MSDLKNLSDCQKRVSGNESLKRREGFAFWFYNRCKHLFNVVYSSYLHGKNNADVEIVKMFEDSLNFCQRKITCEFAKERSFLYATQECGEKRAFQLPLKMTGFLSNLPTL